MHITNIILAINIIKDRYNTDYVNEVNSYLLVCRNNKQSSIWAVRVFTSLNLFLWYLDAFLKDEVPNKEFTEKFEKSVTIISKAGSSNLFNDVFESKVYL